MAMASAETAHCQSWCSESCKNLNGNLNFECGGCLPPVTCRPGAVGFDSWPERAMNTVEDPSLPSRVAKQLPQQLEGTIDQSEEMERSRLLTICPTNASALPVFKRYCQRGIERCSRVASALDWHLENIQPPSIRQTRAALVHRERPSIGAGFAHVVQEQAMVALLGMALDRPVYFYSLPGVFNRQGALLGPERHLRESFLQSPSAVGAGFGSFLFCRAAREKVRASLQLPFRCQRAHGDRGDDLGTAPNLEDSTEGGGGSRWFLTLDDGDAWSVVKALEKGKPPRWNRFTHATRVGPISDYIPARHPVMFSSPSIIAMYMADFVLADETLDVRKRNHRAPVRELAAGRTDLSGPSCLLRAMVGTASDHVLSRVNHALQPTTATDAGGDGRGALLVGLHLRRGDAAMQRECPSCINGDDPDVVDKLERVSKTTLREQLRCVNASLDSIRAAVPGRKVYVFVASDTAEGAAMARAALGEPNVLQVSGTAVHSTRPRATGGTEEAVKVAADWLALAMADVHFGIGDSSFLGNAASAGLGVAVRVGDRAPSGNVCKPLIAAELESLAEQFRPLRLPVPREQAPKGHVEL